MKTTVSGARDLHTLRVVTFCFLVIMLEGFDIQAAGVAAPRLVPEFGLKPAEVGAFLSAAALGSLLFTALGGILADKFGRKRVVIGSTVVFGLFCLATPLAHTPEWLIAMRFLTGAGLGASFPPILALVSDHSPAAEKKRWIGVVYSAISLGGMVAAAMLAAGLVSGWRPIFYVGGVVPLLIAAAMSIGLPETRADQKAAASGKTDWRDILGPGKLLITLALWLVTFLTLSTLYLLVSWLPSILVSNGLKPSDVFTVQMLYNLGSTIAALTVGIALDRKHVFAAPTIGYLALAGGLAYFAGMPFGIVMGGVVGFFLGIGVTTGQTFVYAFAPLCYALPHRASGVGYMLAVGRIGTVAGPFGAGLLFAMGFANTQVLLMLAPAALIALAASLWLSRQFANGVSDAPSEPAALARTAPLAAE